MVRRLFLAAFCVLLVACFSERQAGRASPNAKFASEYWCHIYRPWVAGPKEMAEVAGYQPFDTTGRILHLCPSGDLEIYGGALYKTNLSDIVSLSPGDGLTHFVGKWEIKGGKLLLEYRLVWQDFPPVGKESASHPLIRAAVPFDGKTFVLDGKVFESMRNLSKESIERFFSCPPVRE